jgi:glycosyltransferase involved in cell wall biosynthesis
VRVLAVVPGPERHGVVVHGVAVARAVERAGAAVQVVRHLAPASGDLVHVHFTDALFGSDITSAAAAFEGWRAQVDAPVVVTLHDVPGGDADRARDERRTAGYARVVRAADAVVVSAAHEAARLQHLTTPWVVPLPVLRLAAPGPVPDWAGAPTIGVLGFVYPGKGHDVALEVAAETGVQVVAAGGPSPGHEPLVVALLRRADALGVDLHVTGGLSEADLHAAARAVMVPLAAYRTLGASGSLATWHAACRRPVVSPSDYTRELDQRWPGCLRLADDLVPAVAAALEEPSSTWLREAPQLDVAQEHLAVYRSVVR